MRGAGFDTLIEVHEAVPDRGFRYRRIDQEEGVSRKPLLGGEGFDLLLGGQASVCVGRGALKYVWAGSQ
jgi:hypothetical protein